MASATLFPKTINYTIQDSVKVNVKENDKWSDPVQSWDDDFLSICKKTEQQRCQITFGQGN